jgi:hypothetical protein
MSNPDLHHLTRLERSNYKAFAAVHWTMRVEPARPGWLDDRFHHEFREACLCSRTSGVPDVLYDAGSPASDAAWPRGGERSTERDQIPAVALEPIAKR